MIEELLEGESENLTRKLIELGLKGDGQALRLIFERLNPVRKDRAIFFRLPTITTAADLPKATAAILEGASSGEITPAEAAELGKILESHTRAIEAHDLEKRISAIEALSVDRRDDVGGGDDA